MVWDCVELHRPRLVKAVFGFARGQVFRKGDFVTTSEAVRLAPAMMKEVLALTFKTVSLATMMRTVEWIGGQIKRGSQESPRAARNQ